MLYNILFFLNYLLMSQKSVPLQCVFHSIRFKVNKGWSTAVLLFMPVNQIFPESLFSPFNTDLSFTSMMLMA